MKVNTQLTFGHSKGPFNTYVDKMRGGGDQKMSAFVHAQVIKTVQVGGWGVKNVGIYLVKRHQRGREGSRKNGWPLT